MVLGQRHHERQQREPAEGRAGRHEVAVCLTERRVGSGALVSPDPGVAQLDHARTKDERRGQRDRSVQEVAGRVPPEPREAVRQRAVAGQSSQIRSRSASS